MKFKDRNNWVAAKLTFYPKTNKKDNKVLLNESHLVPVINEENHSECLNGLADIYLYCFNMNN